MNCVVLCIVLCRLCCSMFYFVSIVLFYVLFVCKCVLLPPSVNPIAVKHISHIILWPSEISMTSGAHLPQYEFFLLSQYSMLLLHKADLFNPTFSHLPYCRYSLHRVIQHLANKRTAKHGIPLYAAIVGCVVLIHQYVTVPSKTSVTVRQCSRCNVKTTGYPNVAHRLI